MNIGDLVPWGRTRSAVDSRRESDPFLALQNQIDRLFNDFSRGFGVPAASTGMRAGWPSIDVREDEKNLYVEAELPGMDEKDIEVVLVDNMLTLRGEKRVEHGNAKQQWSERYVGMFERQIPLTADVDGDNVKASFSKGLLTVEIPKTPEAQQRTRRIPVTTT